MSGGVEVNEEQTFIVVPDPDTPDKVATIEVPTVIEVGIQGPSGSTTITEVDGGFF